MKNFLLSVPLLFAVTAFAQSNFTDTPSGDLIGVAAMPEAHAVIFKNNGLEIVDIQLQMDYGQLTGTVKTDTSVRTLTFGFTADGKFDNNSNNGLIIQLTDADGYSLVAGYKAVADLYSYLGDWKLGMQTDRKKAGDGIPTKFILSKEGNIKFEDGGFRWWKKAC